MKRSLRIQSKSTIKHTVNQKKKKKNFKLKFRRFLMVNKNFIELQIFFYIKNEKKKKINQQTSKSETITKFIPQIIVIKKRVTKKKLELIGILLMGLN